MRQSAVVSTVKEIESAIQALPPEKVAEILAWLQAREEQVAQPVSETPGKQPLMGFWKGNIIFKEGWDEPLEDFKEYME